MGNISKNFNCLEFLCKCGCGSNHISPKVVAICQDIRDKLGVPVVINSGYRCKMHNESVGGSPKSLHLIGWAADLSFPNMKIEHAYELMKDLHGVYYSGGLGFYDNFIHIDIGYMRFWDERKF